MEKVQVGVDVDGASLDIILLEGLAKGGHEIVCAIESATEGIPLGSLDDTDLVADIAHPTKLCLAAHQRAHSQAVLFGGAHDLATAVPGGAGDGHQLGRHLATHAASRIDMVRPRFGGSLA